MPDQLVNHIHWHYEERGSDLPVVLLHAFPIDHRLYNAQIESLSTTHRIIVPDLPGFGQTPYDQPFTIQWQAEQLHCLLKSIGALPCIIGGCSMGGYISFAFARTYPNDVAGLIFIDTKAEGDTPEQRHNRDRLIDLTDRHGPSIVADAMLPKMLSEHSKRLHPKLEAQLRQIILSTPPSTLKSALGALRDRADQIDFLPSIACPTLILVGADDQITPLSNAETIKAGISHASLISISNAGHLSPVENPEAVSHAIRAFIARIK
ncbi:MAG TPA: alpha/beta fold hydrolase [Tepidisphaeraceae bacterium]|jgi:pimeloyl-ACP methyl ester carboxylesterase|nr:alpha/beta fold hydrolase [Tepidisphaeraceae bacterium]